MAPPPGVQGPCARHSFRGQYWAGNPNREWILSDVKGDVWGWDCGSVECLPSTVHDPSLAPHTLGVY